MVDQRKMNEIHVTWQLFLFILASCALPVSMGPFYAAEEGNPVPADVLLISGSVAAASLLAMVAAVYSRFRQARREVGTDGLPKSGWFLRQVITGVFFCIAGTILIALLAWMGMPRKPACIGGAIVLVPGVILLGRLLSPPK